MTTPDLSASCLLIIDVQKDFIPGGALAVAGGDEIVAPINELIPQAAAVVFTQDWHPADHSSFASQHEGADPFTMTKASYGDQMLWPDHCVQGSTGAEFCDGLNSDAADLIIRKGFRREIDSYSAFFENDRTTPTGLSGYLRTRGIEKLVLCGLATDYCVGFSALDAVSEGFDVTVLESLTRAIDMGGTLEAMRAQWQDAGVKIA